MKEIGRDSSGERRYISSPENILNVVAKLTGLTRADIQASETEVARQAREIISLLLVENLGASLLETGNFFRGTTAPAIRKLKTRGACRLTKDDEFAHTFAIAERHSNLSHRPL